MASHVLIQRRERLNISRGILAFLMLCMAMVVLRFGLPHLPIVGLAPPVLTLAADHWHQFTYETKINGVLVRNVLFDTGAADVVLSLDVAKRVGIVTRNLKYRQPFSTYLGTVYDAPATVRTLDIGTATLHDFPIFVTRHGMRDVLIGMSAMKLFKVTIDHDQLILENKHE
jgi:clan AA aspartic protease (TIGR02281 family)